MAMHDVGSNLLVSSKEGKKSWGVQTSRGNKSRKLYYIQLQKSVLYIVYGEWNCLGRYFQAVAHNISTI